MTDSFHDCVQSKSSQEIRKTLNQDDRYCPNCGDTQWIVMENTIRNEAETTTLCCTFCDTHWIISYVLHKYTEILEKQSDFQKREEEGNWQDYRQNYEECKEKIKELEEQYDEVDEHKRLDERLEKLLDKIVDRLPIF